MKQLLHRVFPPEFFTSPAYARALVLAVVYVGVVLSQLFTFEKFPDVIHGFGLPGGEVTAVIVAGLLPLVGAAALPFLLSMQLSGWSRRLSGVMVIVTPSLWLLLSLWLVIMQPSGANTGLFGATVATPVGWWLIVFALLWLWSAVLCVRELPPRRKQR